MVALPGIGPYTAAAIASIAFGEAVAVRQAPVDQREVARTGRARLPERGARDRLVSVVLDDQDAIDLGVDIAGYPKRLGDIELDFDSSTMRCGWREDGEEVLSITAPRPTAVAVDERDRMDLITTKGGYVLRSQSVGYVGRAGRVAAAAISLQFGTHQRATDIRKLVQGKCLGGRLVLDRQLALSQPLEAWR